MEPEIVLLILRLVGALILLSFVGLIGWLIYQDMRMTQATMSGEKRSQAILRPLNTDPASDDLSFVLAPVTSIGRARSSTIVLDDDFVSNEHALVMLRGQQWWLEDLNSRNGTLLNETPLTEATIISPGDVITIGNTRLKLEQSPEAVA